MKNCSKIIVGQEETVKRSSFLEHKSPLNMTTSGQTALNSKFICWPSSMKSFKFDTFKHVILNDHY